MRKDLLCPIEIDKMIVFLGMILMVTTFTMSQNNMETTDSTKKEFGIRIINYDLLTNPTYPILYTEIPDTIFVYKKLSDNTMVLYDKYLYDDVERNWVSLGNKNRPRIKISRSKRKDAVIVNIKPCKRDVAD